MNCDNCGAPLTAVKGRDYLCCAYCTTFHFPTPLADSADGLKPLGEADGSECPVCRAALSTGAISDCQVLYCSKCRGVLATNDDFASIIRWKRANWEGATSKPVPINQEEFERSVECPRCGKSMDVHPYYGPGSVVIDSCGQCRVVWLDHGEIAAIESAPGRRG